MLGRVKNGCRIGARSLGVLGDEPRLLGLPISGVLLALVFLVVISVLGVGLATVVPFDTATWPFMIAFVFAVYVAARGITTYFSAALTYCVAQHFAGEPVVLPEGLGAAWRVRGTLLVWTVVAATVGVLLKLCDWFGVIDRLAGVVFGVSWSIIASSIVPIIVIETDVSTRELVMGSTETIGAIWRESATANLGLRLFVALAGVMSIFVVGWLVVFGLVMGGDGFYIALAVGALVFVVVASIFVSRTLAVVARTAPYLYATDRLAVEAFDDVTLMTTDR